MAVLVTGASGFVGGHLVDALVARGEHVRCAVRRTSDRSVLQPLGVEFCEVDLSDYDGLKRSADGVDVVYHLAARTTGQRAADLMQSNAIGSANVARACAALPNPPVVVHVSSVAAAGPTARGGLRTEEDPPAPVSNYGRSKRAGELATAQWAHVVPTTVIRPGIVFGPRGRELLPLFRGIVRTRTHIVPTFAPPPLSLIDVGDLVRLLILAADRGERMSGRPPGGAGPQGIYFASQPEHPDYRELGKMIANAASCPRLAVIHLGQPIPWLIGAAGQFAGSITGHVPHVNIDKMREATAESWACSPKRAQREFDFHCSAPLFDQLRDTANWYRDAGWYEGSLFAA